MPFEAVSETLLRNGIAPRHVRRYVRELNDHLDDLTRQQRDAGYDAEDAALRARAQLGADRDLSAAMLAQPGLRSWPARLPWLVFVILPPVVAVFGVMPLLFLFYFVGDGAWRLSLLTPDQQEILRQISRAAIAGLDILFVPLVMGLFAWIARRQRLAITWPLLGMILLVTLLPHLGYRFGQPGHPHTGSVSIGMMPVFLPGFWPELLRQWPVHLAHMLIGMAPILWLVRSAWRAVKT